MFAAFRRAAPQLTRIIAFGNCDAASALMLAGGAGCDGLVLSNPWTIAQDANGTLDDAAYVALILHLAETRQGKGYRRPVVLGIWTGEEKGLHGSRAFVERPTVPLEKIAGVINLDQLRPIFPLDVLTVHARTDTSLGRDAEAVASARGIRVQDDRSPNATCCAAQITGLSCKRESPA